MKNDRQDLPEDNGGLKDVEGQFLAYHQPVWHPQPVAPPQRIRTNILLFAVTIVTTMMAGALQKGVNPFASPRDLLAGLPFSVALLGILLFHELGHYFVSRYHGVPASLPYFIPVPTLIGTMGAVIRMRSPIRDRRILFDIGIAGPLAGLCLAIPAVMLGLSWSELIQMDSGKGGLELGDSLLFMALTKSVFGRIPEGYTVLLHPVAFAGWLGFFVTSLNLLPMGQLDGGHVVYGIFGPRHRIISRMVFLGLVCWGLHPVFSRIDFFPTAWGLACLFLALRMAMMSNSRPFLRYMFVFLVLINIWENLTPDTSIWLVWAVLMTFIRLDHPPTWDVRIPLDNKRTTLGWMALVIFVLTFIPIPFREILP